MRLEGKRALVTGGGRGIGRAVSLAFAKEGADVAVLARTESEIESVAREVESIGTRGAAVKCDVGSPEEVKAAIGEASSLLGGVDILVANAGMMDHAPVGEIDDEMWDEAIRVNLSSVFWAIRATLGPMISRGWAPRRRNCRAGEWWSLKSSSAHRPNRKSRGWPYPIRL